MNDPGKPLYFLPDNGFQVALHQRVEAYFKAVPDRQRHGNASLWCKSALILAGAATCYVALIWLVTAWWLAVPLAMLLGVLAALIGFNIQHDGGHQAYSAVRWRNRLAATSLDFIGASSYLWHWKHAVFHHGRPNVAGHDTDISVGSILRLEPHQRRAPVHRWQHLYIWFLYCLMAGRWQLYDDLREVINGAIGPHRIPRPRGRDLAIFIVGKIVFVSLAIVIPLWFHPWWCVVVGYFIVSATLGLTLAVVFQLAHNTELVDFPTPPDADGQMPHTWAEHQVLTAADFSRGSRVVTWLLGGLNFQIEHHLFPHISHIHYQALSPIVEATCREYGIRFREHASFVAGVRAHVAWLRHLGNN